MTSILIGWVNEELQLDPPLTEATLAGELSSGFVLGALLHRHNQLPQHHKLRRRDTADSKIQNFCLLEPALCKLGVKFDANVAHRPRSPAAENKKGQRLQQDCQHWCAPGINDALAGVIASLIVEHDGDPKRFHAAMVARE